MTYYRIVNKDGASYYGQSFKSLSEAKEALAFTMQHDPEAEIKKIEIPYTNADHIRNLTNEEMADYLTSNPFGWAAWATEMGREIVHERIVEWLQKSYEKENE
jgi:hypothetical protein